MKRVIMCVVKNVLFVMVILFLMSAESLIDMLCNALW